MARAFHTIKGKTFGSNPLSRNFRIHTLRGQSSELNEFEGRRFESCWMQKNFNALVAQLGRAANLMSSKVPGSSPGRRETTHGWLNW